MKIYVFRLMSIIVLLIDLFAFTQWISSTPTAHACTQPPGGLPDYTLEDRVGFAPIVLEGHVVEVNPSLYPVTAMIEVKQYFKGGGGPSILTVSNFGDSSMCLSMVHVGDNIILFASGDPSSGQLTAFYASQFDAVTPSTPERVQRVVDAVGQPPILPDIAPSLTPEPEEFASGGEVNNNPMVSFGPLELCLGLLFAPLLLGSVLVVGRASKK
ncbi:MAG: hypothetical protein K8L91_23475 [Anaerolineae bacterium]|nr:hypothetical protein [Anaerolineae bacterium]